MFSIIRRNDSQHQSALFPGHVHCLFHSMYRRLPKGRTASRIKSDNGIPVCLQLLSVITHMLSFVATRTILSWLKAFFVHEKTRKHWCLRAFTNSPSRARTYNNSVNSRVLYHWAIEDYNYFPGVQIYNRYCFCTLKTEHWISVLHIIRFSYLFPGNLSRFSFLVKHSSD